MQQESTPEIPSFAISHLSEYYYFYCNKLLHKFSDRNDVIKPNPKKRKKDHSKLKEASQNRGIKFEDKVLRQLEKQLGNVENCQNKSVFETLEILKTAKIGKFLYQPKFKIREELYGELGIKDFRIKDFVPDFIEVIKEDDKKCLMILDAKATKETRVSHQVQVTTYAYLLGHIVKNIENVEISISRTGGIFLPSAEGFTRQTFSIDLFLPKIERFLYRELPQIISTSKVSWHYNSRCKECKFVDECRKEAEGTMAMIPYLSMEDASYLKQVLNKIIPYKDEPDIEDLNIYIRNGSDDRRVKQIIRYNTKSKKSPYLEHLESKKSPNFESKTSAQFIHTPTATFPQQTDHNLVIVMSWDNFVSRPFSWFICLFDRDGNIEENFKGVKSNSKSENETLISFISLMKEFVTCLENIFEYLSQNNSRTCIFVYSQKEKISIQDSLLNLIALDSNLITKDDQFKAMRCLFNIFQDCSLLLAASNNDDESSKLPDKWREFPRLIVLENSLKENIAINVSGFYRITDVWEQMVMPTLESSQVSNNLESYIDKIDLENIYAKWVEDEEVNTILLMRSEFINYVIKSYYALLKSSTNDIASILIFSPQKFVFSNVRDFNHHYLGKLYFFKQFEAFTSSNQKKRDRLKDLAQGEATCKIRFDKIINELDIYESIAQFIVCDKESFTFEATGFKKFILVEDNSEGTRKAICFSDMKYKNKSKCPLPVLSLKKVDNGHEDIIIQLKGKFTNMTLKNNGTYRLYERYVDFNTDKVLKVLEKIDGEQENSLFLNILKDPKEFSLSGKRQHPKELNDILEQCDKFSMSQSHKKIAQELLKKRLQIVWGPPGSGKTHFLALFVTWYLTSVIPRETNFIIGITACTNDAIDNLLHRISHLLELHKKESDFSCCRVVEFKNNKPNRAVLGGTVWDWYKIREKYSCDIMVIDEGSQLLASDACVVMEVLDPDDGKLIIAGDHMQLGPIIHNTYPIFQDKHPLIFGSIQQCLMRKEDGTSFNGDFFLNEKGSERDYGPYTLQLNENWRMNVELNSFFQEIYGDNYESKDTNLKLDLDLSKIKDQEIEKIFRSKAAITLVKLILNNHENSGLVEADVVAKIVSGYFDAIPKNCNDKPSLIVVTPQHSQRRAIQSKVKNYLENSEFNLKIGTVDKMQGQQADLVIACFGFHDVNEITQKSSFLFDPNRWNVAISRARCQVILILTNEMLDPKGIEILSKKKTSEGLAYISKLEAWAQEKEKREKNSAIIELKID